MRADRPILLFESDLPVRCSLQFAFGLDGFVMEDGAAEGADPSAACCLVVDQRFRGDGAGFLQALRGSGVAAPAILLATNPTRALHARTAAAGATLIEKPLLGDELAQALRAILTCIEAA